ncbi:30S ribosomal protein S8e [Candidatus Geothermarchaeota archaeon]|nr:MAG: 30S ribosomal protein S8e [Candidatus Geothermarchaeota archaeon]HEW93475.1 30S ribosomal protein S8e [Thermoprotei archaeon]
MVQWHWDLHKRKKTGGRRYIWRKKRKYERGGEPTETILGPERIRVDMVKGGNIKVRLLRGEYVNLFIPGENKTIKTKIVKVLDNPANRDYSRRGVITKGARILTEYGEAIITSRPGQNGVLNARLLKSEV